MILINNTNKNIISGIVLQITTAITGILLTKIYLLSFGTVINGLIISIKQFLSYFSLFEAGIGAAAIALLYKPVVQKDIAGINKILSAARKYYIKTGILFISSVILFSFLYPFFTKKEVPVYLSGVLVLILGLIACADFFLIGKYRILLTADNKLYILNIVQTSGILLVFIISCFLYKINSGVILIQLVPAFVYLPRYLFLFYFFNKNYKSIQFTNNDKNFKIPQSNDALIHQIISLIVYNTPFVLLTLFCALSDVSVYGIYYMIIFALQLLIGSFNTGSTARFGQLIARNNKEELFRQYNKYISLYFMFTTILYVCLAVLLLPFIRIYTNDINDNQYVNKIYAVLFCLNSFISNIRSPAAILINGSGHFKETKYRAFTEGLIGLVISSVLIRRLGILAILTGSFCSSLYRTIDVLFYTEKRILPDSLVKTLKYLLIYSIPGIIIFVFFQKFVVYLPNSIFDWILYAFAVTLSSFILIFPLFILLNNRLNKQYAD
jgi:O-antigen/teichoic acid export membrane protein